LQPRRASSDWPAARHDFHRRSAGAPVGRQVASPWWIGPSAPDADAGRLVGGHHGWRDRSDVREVVRGPAASHPPGEKGGREAVACADRVEDRGVDDGNGVSAARRDDSRARCASCEQDRASAPIDQTRHGSLRRPHRVGVAEVLDACLDRVGSDDDDSLKPPDVAVAVADSVGGDS
jgi:hypothetical protein